MRDYDITNGGRAFPVAIIRVGKMVRVDKYKFKCAYRDDGTYYYPRILENQIRKNGELNFKSFGLTGSSGGTEKNPKISLLSVYRREIIPAIEEKHADISEGGCFKVLEVKQEDGVGPHQDVVYHREISEEFRWRDWMLFNQPPQSPITNVKDTCLFLMWSNMCQIIRLFPLGSNS